MKYNVSNQQKTVTGVSGNLDVAVDKPWYKNVKTITGVAAPAQAKGEA